MVKFKIIKRYGLKIRIGPGQVSGVGFQLAQMNPDCESTLTYCLRKFQDLMP